MMNRPGTLSVCMIVRNEAERIGEALRSFQAFADEIVVVDTGSADNTKAIARQFTSQVFDFPWCDDFAAARNVSLEHARSSHVLWLDADDSVDSVNADKLVRLKDMLAADTGYFLLLQDLRQGIPYHSLYQLRCVPNRPDVRFEGRIHELLAPSATAAGLRLVGADITITHHGYEDPTLLRAKVTRNIRLIQREIKEGRGDSKIQYFLAQGHAYLGEHGKAVAAMRRVLVLLEKDALERPFSEADLLEHRRLLTDGCLFLAEHLPAAGGIADARRFLVKARAAAGDDGYALYQIGRLWQKLGDHEQALAALQAALQAPKEMCQLPRLPLTDADILLRLAYSCLCLNREEAATGLVARAQSFPGVHHAWQEFAAQAMADKRFDLAGTAYDRAEAEGDLGADACSNRGLLWGKAGEFDKARRAFGRALEKQPTHLDALTNWANMELRLERFAEAFEFYQDAIAAGRDDLDVLLACCATGHRTGQSGSPGMRGSIANVLKKQGQGESAKDGEADFRQLFLWAREVAAVRQDALLLQWAGLLQKHVLRERC